MYCGGLPQNPKPPFNYKLVFNVEGLVAEYTDDAIAVRNGKVAHIPTLTDLEEIEWPELGKMEAFVTSGGTSTAPYSFEGKLNTYEYKTIRFPGHCERMRIFMDYGFWDEDKIEVDGTQVRPREVFHKLMSEGLRDDEDGDQILVRAWATGKKAGQDGRHQIDIWDKQDTDTGFSAMERMTGFPAAIYAHEIAKGNVESGCVRYELAIPGTVVVDGLKQRGIDIKES
jgi:lysine 6-dehydrogenase